MMGYAPLMGTDPSAWTTIADRMRAFAEAVAYRADELGSLISSLGDGWTGTAARTALARLESVRAELLAAYPGIVAIDQTLTELAVAVADTQDRLIIAADPGPGSIVVVEPDGTVTLDPTERPPDWRDAAELLSVRAAVDHALDAADRSDADAADRLRSIGFVVDPSAAPPPSPPVGTDPAGVAAWWRALTPEQRRYLVVVDPAMVAALDGVPADARDQASRLLLHRQIDRLETEDTLLRAGTGADVAALTGVDARLDGVQALADRLGEGGADRAYLLGIDAPDDRAIVAIGDPDDAANTLTLVPGMDSGVHNVRPMLAAVDHIAHASATLLPTDSWTPADAGGLATVAWLDYDAPGTIGDATDIRPATGAAAPLSKFLDGLRVTGRPDGHESVLGYSYGSVVVGAAAGAGGLPTDDVILVASPGTGLRHAADLGVPPDHVWATAARHDLVPRLGPAPDHGWFGPNPTSPGFGARVFTSAPGSIAHPVRTHTSYFDPGNPALTNIARIATGDPTDVS
jgi:hypothetical protein